MNDDEGMMKIEWTNVEIVFLHTDCELEGLIRCWEITTILFLLPLSIVVCRQTTGGNDKGNNCATIFRLEQIHCSMQFSAG